MNYSALLVALPMLLAAGLASAGDKVDESLEADATGVVSIRNIRGRVEVRGWDKNTVSVSGELDDLAKGLEFSREGKVTRIDVELPEQNINSGDGSDLRIRVPQGSRVEFRGVSSSLDIENIDGDVALKTVSGDVGVAKVAGNVSIKTVSGTLGVHGGGGETQVKSVSGDLKLELKSREVRVSTVSGDVELELTEFDSLNASTVSGDLEIEGNLASAGTVEIKTVSGNIRLALGGPVNARVSIRTGPGGEIINELSDAQPEELFPAQEQLETTLGDGSGDITISTVTGTVELEKR